MDSGRLVGRDQNIKPLDLQYFAAGWEASPRAIGRESSMTIVNKRALGEMKLISRQKEKPSIATHTL